MYLKYQIIYFSLALFFNLKVELKLSKHYLKTKQTLDLNLIASPDSTVYLMGVDKSVNLLKAGNNIDRAKVSREITKLAPKKSNDEINGDTNMYIIKSKTQLLNLCELSPRFSGDKIYHKKIEKPNIQETFDDELNDFQSTTRTEFPETWFFEKVNVGKGGSMSLQKKVPDTITSWDITAFTASKKKGFALAKPQKLTVMQSFFVKLYLPHSVRVGEILKVEAAVFSYFEKQKYDELLSVDVTLFSEADEIIPDRNAESETLAGEFWPFEIFCKRSLDKLQFRQIKCINRIVYIN